MTLNYQMIVEDIFKSDGVVGSLIPEYEIIFLLDGN